LRQEGMVDRVGDRLEGQVDSTGKIADNVRQASDAFKVWDEQIHVGGNLPAMPGKQANPSQLTIQGTDLTSSIAKGGEDASASIDKLGSSFDRLGNAIGGAAGGWLSYIGNLISTLPDALAAIASLTTAQEAQTTANATTAATGAASSVASIPYVGPILAVAAIASVMAAIMSMPKLAAGGMAYGPTTAMVGEYAGASNNPEVIAPLNKLKGIMGNTGPVQVYGRLKGRDIYLSASRYGDSINANS
jgi:hypothetical protein